MFTPCGQLGQKYSSMGVTHVFQGRTLWDVFTARVQVHPLTLEIKSVYPRAPKQGKPLRYFYPIPLYCFESVFVFSFAVPLMTPKAVTQVFRSGNSFACPSTKNKNTHGFQKGVGRGALSVFFGLFWGFWPLKGDDAAHEMSGKFFMICTKLQQGEDPNSV